MKYESGWAMGRKYTGMTKQEFFKEGWYDSCTFLIGLNIRNVKDFLPRSAMTWTTRDDDGQTDPQNTFWLKNTYLTFVIGIKLPYHHLLQSMDSLKLSTCGM